MEKCITKSIICGMDVHESTIKTCTAAGNGCLLYTSDAADE